MYAGLQTADTDEGRMDVLVRELERTGAFDRKVLVIIPTTGTGWVNPIAARAIEMMYNGDTAMVGSQYSYLPSWISFLGDQQKSMESGRHDDRRRPRPVGAAAARPTARAGALRRKPRLDGGPGRVRLAARHRRMGFSSVLWVGPPNASPLWRGVTVRRDPGTPEVEPRYDNGRTVRFSQGNDAAEIAADAAPPWDGTRVLFLQHPPTRSSGGRRICCSPGPTGSPSRRGATGRRRCGGIPIVTFWQVRADMTNAASVPGGHGHNYGDFILDGWAGVAPPDGLDAGRHRTDPDRLAADRVGRRP